LFAAAAMRGLFVTDDRAAIGYPPDEPVPGAVSTALVFQQWLATATLEQRRGYAGLNRARSLQVSAAGRARAAVAMLVLGDAKATKIREVCWSRRGEDWWTSTATWAPSELTRLPAETFDAIIDCGGRIRHAVTQHQITERDFRLDVAEVAQLILTQDWTGPGTVPPWSKSAKISQPPPRTGYKDYPSYIAYRY